MENKLRWKMTFDGRQNFMEDGIGWKTVFVGRIRRWKAKFMSGKAFYSDFFQSQKHVSANGKRAAFFSLVQYIDWRREEMVALLFGTAGIKLFFSP